MAKRTPKRPPSAAPTAPAAPLHGELPPPPVQPTAADPARPPRLSELTGADGKIAPEDLADPTTRLQIAERITGQGTPCPYHKLPTLATHSEARITYYRCRVRGCHYRTKRHRQVGEPPPRPAPFEADPPR